MQPKTILVTGCAGFIGSNFTRVFHERYPATEIIGVDDLSTGRKSEVGKHVTFYKQSIVHVDKLKALFAKHKPEYVFHFAALPRVAFSMEQPTRSAEANILGTIALLEAAQATGVKRVILSSSSSVYGGAKKLPTRERDTACNPQSPYALQKYVDELVAQKFGEYYGLDTVCLRYFSVFGPGQYGDSAYATVISAWLEALHFPTAKKAFLEGDGKQSRDFSYIDNVIEANILSMLAKKPLKGIALNIGDGGRTDLREVKKLIESVTGKKIALEQRPPRKGDVKHTHADTSLAKKIIGYKPKVSFADGMKRTVTWFEQRKK